MGTCPVVAIVGAGFCGALLAVHLVRAGGVSVALVDRTGRFGPGLAYGAAGPLHLLNTPAGRMSAFADDPDHFTRWARERDPTVTGGSFLPRPVYGAYLEALLAACPRGQVGEPGLACLQGQVDDLVLAPAGARLHLADGSSLHAARVALCPGNPPPTTLAGLADDPRIIPDPWRFDPRRLDPALPVLLLGTGLTCLDVALTIADAGHPGPLLAVSRRGLLPLPHRPAARPGSFPTPDITTWPTSARGLLRVVRAEVRAAAAEGFDWREVIASLRPVTAALWRRLPLPEQDRFLRHLRPYWDSHRHRAAPDTHAAVADLQAAGRFVVHAARLVAVVADPRGLRVALAHGSTRSEHVVGGVIDCTGPASDLRRGGDPLLRALLDRGLAEVDPLGLGLRTESDGRLAPDSPLWLAGPLRRAEAWEATAVLELAAQVAGVAARIRASW